MIVINIILLRERMRHPEQGLFVDTDIVGTIFTWYHFALVPGFAGLHESRTPDVKRFVTCTLLIMGDPRPRKDMTRCRRCFLWLVRCRRRFLNLIGCRRFYLCFVCCRRCFLLVCCRTCFLHLIRCRRWFLLSFVRCRRCFHYFFNCRMCFSIWLIAAGAFFICVAAGLFFGWLLGSTIANWRTTGNIEVEVAITGTCKPPSWVIRHPIESSWRDL